MKGTPEERFWQKVKKTRKCWLWVGATSGEGYGTLWIGYSNVSAHRFSYELHKGSIPDDMLVCHTCDVRNCVRPSHLWLGTPIDNQNDMYNKGRENKASGEDIGNTKLTWKEVRFIRKFYRQHAFTRTQQQLANRFGVSNQTISDILSNKTWKE